MTIPYLSYLLACAFTSTDEASFLDRAGPPLAGTTLVVDAPVLVTRGDTLSWQVSGAAPGAAVRLLVSAGEGPRACPAALAPDCLDLRSPVNASPPVSADANGVATFSQPVPADARAAAISVQAVETHPGATYLSPPHTTDVVGGAAQCSDVEGLPWTSPEILWRVSAVSWDTATQSSPWPFTSYDGHGHLKLTSAAQYQDFQDAIGRSLPPVDFSQEQVAISRAYLPSSCEAGVREVRLYDHPSFGRQLWIDAYNASRNCCAACDMVFSWALVVRVPFTEPYALCQRATGGCRPGTPGYCGP
jgi:hypothetical protein